LLNVDKALSLFTDSILKGEDVKVEDFKENMSNEDYTEFCELASFTELLRDSQDFNNHETKFEDLHKLKESIYDIPKVANFRTDEGGQPTKEAQDNIDKLFEEEFTDE